MLAKYVLSGRQKRFRKFIRAIDHPRTRPLRVLDVGGTAEYWAQMPWDELQPLEVVLLNTFAQVTVGPFVSIVGDARNLSAFADHAFDLVFAHSVIGHVGTLSDQLRMAREIQRVGRQMILRRPIATFPSTGARSCRSFTFYRFPFKHGVSNMFEWGGITA